MGQKVNPVGFRVGTFSPWKSRWFQDDKNYRTNLLEDINLRKTLFRKLKTAGVSLIEIERLPKSIVLTLTVARPGVVIGRGGTGIEEIKRFIVSEIEKVGGKNVKDVKIDLKVNEVKNPELSAHLVADRIALDLERRMPYRKVVSKTLDRVMQSGALGIKVVLAGRIQGAEISRTEKFHKGSVPLQSLREDIEYAQVPALTKRGYVGVKVYIHRKPE
ncbi:MAG: 30S ribosomal protein S3 [Candidatus Woesebacteria bacterium GW2011_GWA1_39_21]|uniref:Small ribosomal subunit protein uS3 n=2 Tax=root TaxID=1 RepID=A0A0G0RD15_9BACT|nr:30S ribosomal protein S3 [uncultured organism]KKR11582.1 MAG: 30S ribosomal protein S3 [Candidatus Woesebacteria bacterium GW2011_GWA1_39_21]